MLYEKGRKMDTIIEEEHTRFTDITMPKQVAKHKVVKCQGLFVPGNHQAHKKRRNTTS